MYNFEPLTAFLNSEAKNYKIPAVDMLIMKNGEYVYRHMAGYSDPDKKKPVSEKDLYWIYSASKISTCTAAMRLIEDGKLSLDDPVARYLPRFADLTVVSESGKPRLAKNVMTVRHLMTMTGGLDYDMMRGSVGEVLKIKGEAAGTADIANAFAAAPLLFEPGAHFRYSLCHDVLGAVIEKASGERFSDYLNTTVFWPLGMNDTTFHPTEKQLSRVSALWSVNPDTGELEYVGDRRTSPLPEAYESGGGGLLSSVNDYIKLAITLANNGKAANGYRLLKPETVELFRTPQLNGMQLQDMHEAFEQMRGYTYALGVRRFIDDRGSCCPLGHFGWDGAAGFYVMIEPASKVTFVYAQHVLQSGVTFHLIHKQIRDLAFLCMRE